MPPCCNGAAKREPGSPRNQRATAAGYFFRRVRVLLRTKRHRLKRGTLLAVQVVDPVWLPISGAQVTLKPLGGKEQSESNSTDQEGVCEIPDSLRR